MRKNNVPKQAAPQLFYCGTSNVELPVPNKSHFPAEYHDKSRLCFYSSLFNTVEINSSFYKIPMQRTVEKWSQDVAEGFLFTFKLWRGITHAKELIYDPADISRFMTAINGVGEKKGCILIQFPASVKFSSFRKIHKLLDDLFVIPGMEQWGIAIEFRDKSWYNDTVYQMLEAYKTAVVMHDMPASATSLIDMDTTFSYFRFHGEKGDYRGSYETDVLHDYALSISHELNTGRKVFAYFNNTIGGAVHNALELADITKGVK